MPTNNYFGGWGGGSCQGQDFERKYIFSSQVCIFAVNSLISAFTFIC